MLTKICHSFSRSFKLKCLSSLIFHKDLIFALASREIKSKYKGTFFGFGWSLFQPLALLTAYTFVFSVVFKARWPVSSNIQNSNLEYGFQVFCGLIAFNLIAEVVGESSSLVSNNVNYIKKVVFPLEILSLLKVVVSFYTAFISLLALLVGVVITTRVIHLEWLWLPVIMFNLASLALCASWLLSSTLVYVKDLGQLITLGLNLLMFLTPIFYSVQSLPQHIAFLSALNPLAIIVEQLRSVILSHSSPNINHLILFTVFMCLCVEFSFRFFKTLSVDFADLL